jgi:hypothetical protein
MKRLFLLLAGLGGAVVLCAVVSCDRPPANIDKELVVVKNYAEQYQLDSRHITFLLEMPPPEIGEALKVLSGTKTRKHEPYVLLVLLKLYRNHYLHAHQSYELREVGSREVKNPLLKEYCRLTGIYPVFWEFLPSDHVYGWIEEHPKVLEYPALATEMRKTRKLVEDWERRLEQENDETKKRI